MAVKVAGSNIELFFGEQVDVEAGEMPTKVGEFTDSTHRRGTVGLHTASNASDFSNIVVFGPGGAFAMDAQGKLATVWGALKQ